MATQRKPVLPRAPIRYADKAALNRLMDEIEERMGFVPYPDATPRKAREMMMADGVRPEDNIFSREIMRMRYGDDWEKA